MKTPGIIGGIGPESTIEYYRLLIKNYREKTNSSDYPEIIINSINMTRMLEYVFNNQLDELVTFLANNVKVLEKAGADFAVMASNTPHIVFDRVAETVSIPMISIVDVCCQKMQQLDLKKACLFGTRSTMSAGFYQETAKKYGIELVIPEQKDIDFIHDKYMSELVFKDIREKTRKELIRIAMDIKKKYRIEGLVLGGTELPLALSQKDFQDIIVLNTTVIHVDSIIQRMVEDRGNS